MAFDFPNNPAVNDEFVGGASTYVFNGTGWTMKGADGGAPAGDFVLKTGDTMSGDLFIAKDAAGLVVNSTGANQAIISGQKNGLARWQIHPGDAIAETGTGNTGSNFNIQRFDDAGLPITPYVLSIDRASGNTVLNGMMRIANTTDYATLALYSASTHAPTVAGNVDGKNKWDMWFGYGAGGDFIMRRFLDDGIGTLGALAISRATGDVLVESATMGSSQLTTALSVRGSIGAACAWLGDPASYNVLMVGGHQGYTSKVSVMFTGGVTGNGISSMEGSGGNSSHIYFMNNAGVGCGVIHQPNASSVTYNTTSDMALKEDLKSFDAGNIIDDTNVYDFAWKDSGERAYGIMAQQAIEVYPQAITHLEEGERGPEFWGVDYSKYVPVLLQELKSMRLRIRELEQLAGIKPPAVDPKKG